MIQIHNGKTNDERIDQKIEIFLMAENRIINEQQKNARNIFDSLKKSILKNFPLSHHVIF